MTIAGNVISCDECGRQMSLSTEPQPTGKQSLDERVRAYALEQGWTSVDGHDFCPGRLT